jgi:glycosyltransferase involved in cell wall biosynthesis
LSERSEADTDVDWYENTPGTWLPQTILDGAPLERIRLPDDKGKARNKIYYDALLEACRRDLQGPVVAQLLTNLRPGARPWLRKLRQNNIATSYSMSTYPKWPGKLNKRLIRTPAYRRLFSELDALITNSEPIRTFLQKLDIPTRIEYIPNGVNLERFHPVDSHPDQDDKCALRGSLGIPAGHRLIVSVGAIMPRKGSVHVIRAWSNILEEFPDTHLLFVGPRADVFNAKLKGYNEKISRLIDSSRAPGQVHFTGVVDDVERYLRAADIFVLASDREGTPNSVLEAMASELPCIVTPFSGISSAIGVPDTHFRQVAREPEAISRALRAYLKDPQLAMTQGKTGRRFVIENADRNKTLDQYAELYRELGEAALSRRDK